MVWTRPADETTALPVDALAVLVLQDYRDTQGWNWRNWMLKSEHWGTAPAGPGFEHGLLVDHDDTNTGGTTSTLEYIPLNQVTNLTAP